MATLGSAATCERRHCSTNEALLPREAWEDYLYWQRVDRKMLRLVNELIRDTLREPFAGIGKPEPLKHQLAGAWSRRIDQEHRLVYTV